LFYTSKIKLTPIEPSVSFRNSSIAARKLLDDAEKSGAMPIAKRNF